MIPLIPWYITLIVLVTNVAIAAGVWSILSRAAGRSVLPPASQRSVRAGVALFLGADLGAAPSSRPSGAAAGD